MPSKKNFLITAGPTREYIDPVRYLSNASSGLMGYALAKAAVKRGHNVVLISGPVALLPYPRVKLVRVVSALEMFAQVKKYIKAADIVIGAAAVSDYRPIKKSINKIKKNSEYLELKLVKNPDIVEYAGKVKGCRVLVGFCLESQRLLESAREKMLNKNMDLVVANYPSAIGSKVSEVCLCDRSSKTIKISNESKEKIAVRIINEAIGISKTIKAC